MEGGEGPGVGRDANAPADWCAAEPGCLSATDGVIRWRRALGRGVRKGRGAGARLSSQLDC